MNVSSKKMSVPGARQFAAMMFLMCLMCWLPDQAQAFVENNVRCSRIGGADNVQELGSVSPGQQIFFAIVLDCTVLRRFPVALNISYTSQYANVLTGPKFNVGLNGMAVSQGGMGTTGGSCVPYTCSSLPVGYRFQTVVTFNGQAGNAVGKYVFIYGLFATSLGYENYSDNIDAGVLFYTVENPSCSLVSPSATNLYFGTLSSADLSAASQTANIDISCKAATKATVKLTPAQNIVSSTGGVSATTLSGLSMASSWSDTGAAVNFGSARSFNFTTGNNSMGVRFQPQLNSSTVQAVGSFSSQYTLTITYL
ncbi:hypothetical protein [Pseudomonas promysalinigenes]|uniref:hypothetical protein n=1 Tax=Pseudomonas promysalinigenes TaxID=485898 RepID=UPI003FA034FC